MEDNRMLQKIVFSSQILSNHVLARYQ